MTQKTLLEVKNLGIRNTSIDGISFDVREREIVAILGRSKSGKTLILLALANIISHKGKIIINKKINPNEFIGYSFFEKIDEPYDDEQVKDYLELKGIKSQNKKLFRDISPLERALIGLKKADAELMLLDEPTKNLTKEEKKVFWNNVPKDKTIIFSTIDEDEARLAKVIVRL